LKYVDVSVLMSVYYREHAQNLSEALESIVHQTYIPKQLVIVCDGKLPTDIISSLNYFENKYSKTIKLTMVSLIERVNLGLALNIGLRHCDYNLIARMDSDDHALPRRIETQYNFFKENAIVKVLSGTISEFSTKWSNPVSYRKVPLEAERISSFSCRRNPVNHMAVMFDRDFVQNEMNGYNDIPGFEDYELWLRVLKRDSNAIRNLPDVLVAARVTNLQDRRGGWDYVKKNSYARITFLKKKLIPFKDFIITLNYSYLPKKSSVFMFFKN